MRVCTLLLALARGWVPEEADETCIDPVDLGTEPAASREECLAACAGFQLCSKFRWDGERCFLVARCMTPERKGELVKQRVMAIRGLLAGTALDGFVSDRTLEGLSVFAPVDPKVCTPMIVTLEFMAGATDAFLETVETEFDTTLRATLDGSNFRTADGGAFNFITRAAGVGGLPPGTELLLGLISDAERIVSAVYRFAALMRMMYGICFRADVSEELAQGVLSLQDGHSRLSRVMFSVFWQGKLSVADSWQATKQSADVYSVLVDVAVAHKKVLHIVRRAKQDLLDFSVGYEVMTEPVYYHRDGGFTKMHWMSTTACMDGTGAGLMDGL
mmetsp:Transcript_6130/g.14792  ORF Transcript_6130/g.14792 Transcript_6130/m.14792 type:complete len:330 (-) Transcript_6130:419-1408(-)